MWTETIPTPKGQCPKCRQKGKLTYTTGVAGKQQIHYYKCDNPKCNLRWSETK